MERVLFRHKEGQDAQESLQEPGAFTARAGRIAATSAVRRPCRSAPGHAEADSGRKVLSQVGEVSRRGFTRRGLRGARREVSSCKTMSIR